MASRGLVGLAFEGWLFLTSGLVAGLLFQNRTGLLAVWAAGELSLLENIKKESKEFV